LWIVTIISSGCGGGGGGGDNNPGNNNGTPHGKNLSSSVGDSKDPIIAADSSGNVYVAWEEEGDPTGTGLYKLNLKTSRDSGGTFSFIEDLSKTYCGSSGQVSSSGAVIVSDGSGSSYASWVDRYLTGTTEIRFAKLDGSPSCKSVSDNSSNLKTSPDLIIGSDGRIHIVWAEEGQGQKDIRYRYSPDGGGTFAKPDYPVSGTFETPLDSSGPLLAIEGSLNVDLVWIEGSQSANLDVFFSKSMDSGANFSSPASISDGERDAHCPVIAAPGEGKIYVAYKGGQDIYFVRWSSSTSSFTPPVNISSYPLSSTSPGCPEMAVSSNGVIYILWEYNNGIWFTKSSDGGYSFTSPKDLSLPNGRSSSPKMAVAGSHVNVIWVEEDEGDGDIYLRVSRDNGKTFSLPKNLSNTWTPSRNPAIATDGWRYIYVVWEESIPGRGGDKGEIYFLRDEGSWGLPAMGRRNLTSFLDIDGDEKSDVVLGAPLSKGIGESYVFLSKTLGRYFLSSRNTDPSEADYILSEGETGDWFGHSVAIAGDINGDGYADIIVGAPYADSAGETDSGTVYIYYGDTPQRMDKIPDVVIRGVSEGDHLGWSVSSAGDVNGDGFDDIVIGAPDAYRGQEPRAGVAYIFFGGPYLGYKPGYPDALSAEDADVKLNGEGSQDKFGSAVSSAGDFNGDGYDDVIIGAPQARVSGIASGRAYIYYGGSPMNNLVDVSITAEAAFDSLGSSVAQGGDMDGNGCSEVVIGAPYAEGGGQKRGRVYVIYGNSRDCGGDLLPEDIDLSATNIPGAVLSGTKDYEHFGYSVSYAGDIDGDTFGDIIVGSLYQGTECKVPSGTTCAKYFPGAAYVYRGRPAESMNTTPFLTLEGEDQTDRFGTAVAGAGDLNGDGYYDILVGAYLADGIDSISNAGKAYVYSGGAPQPNPYADVVIIGNQISGQAGYSLYRRELP